MPLGMEALDEIAAIIDLVMLKERAIEIGPHLTTHRTPKLVEGVILAKVTSRVGINHGAEEAPMQMGLRISGRPVGHIVERWIVLHHGKEDLALDDHEAGRCLVR